VKRDPHRLAADACTHLIPDAWLPFRTTAELEPQHGMIGQERAMRAIDLGLVIPTRGYNIFAVGEAGSGKTSTLERLLQERAAKEPVPPDLCYVYSFAHTDRPRPLLLPAGRGRRFAKDVDRMVSELKRLIPRVLSDAAFGPIRAEIMAETRGRAESLTRRAAREAEALGLQIQEDDNNLRVLPVKDGQPLSKEEYEQLPRTRRRKIQSAVVAFQQHLDAYAYGRRQLERQHSERMTAAEVRAITPIVTEALDELTSRYKRFDGGVAEFLAEMRAHILENHRTFLPPEESAEEPVEIDKENTEPHRIYQVNVVVDRTDQKGAPVIKERVPSSSNLCGYFEYRSASGGLMTDHNLIRAGALHQANGGYLLIQATDLMTQDGGWEALKRTLRHQEIRIEEGNEAGEGKTRIAGAMKPGSVDVSVKVIVVGAPELYYYLKLEDPDFGRLFKVKAEFEPSMPLTRENVLRFARFLGTIVREEGYLPLHRSGVARLVEHASRVAEDQHRMTTHRAGPIDLVAEANFYATAEKAKAIRREHLDRALAEVRRRNGAPADAVDRAIRDGSIFIRTSGAVVGQLNGIALYDLVGTSFGVPVRITSRTYAGRRGVVNIDREVHLTGTIHDKGALILVGYLGGQFAQDKVLGLSASITFEQSYDEIDGDSASSAELYAMLSSLSGCPIRQGIAVTGSVNQMGEVQPIGGVNEKIEGIFRICQARGLTGREGVMIPTANLKNLLLEGPVLGAIRAGKFNVWAVSTIDEGIEVLTGVPAGRRRRDGTFTPGSINERVQRRLIELQAVVQRSGEALAAPREL
jgi:predicted ATP-dependent protease